MQSSIVRLATLSVVSALTIAALATSCSADDKDKKERHKHLTVNPSSPPLSIDIVKNSPTSCSILPQHPTVSTSNNNDIYWHADDPNTVYQVNWTYTCGGNKSSGNIVVPDGKSVTGDSGHYGAQSCSDVYQFSYTVSIQTAPGVYQQCSPAGAYIGVIVKP